MAINSLALLKIVYFFKKSIYFGFLGWEEFAKFFLSFTIG